MIAPLTESRRPLWRVVNQKSMKVGVPTLDLTHCKYYIKALR
jgi:hypothetical protein